MSHATAKAQRAFARLAVRDELTRVGVTNPSREQVKEAAEKFTRIAGGMMTNAIRGGQVKTRIPHQPRAGCLA